MYCYSHVPGLQKGRKKSSTSNCCETDSSCENHNKAQNSAAKGIPSTPAIACRGSTPSTPATQPEIPTPQKNGRSEDSAFVITYTDGYPSLKDERPSWDLSQVARIQSDNFGKQPNGDLNSPRRKQEIVTALEIDQRQQVISTEDDIVSLLEEDSIDLDHVNRQLFLKLEESQNDVLASIVLSEKAKESADEMEQQAFSKIPEHPALGNLEKYRSGLVACRLPQTTSTAAKGDMQNNLFSESDQSLDRGSVSEGFKSLWDETTKNLESMNKVFSSCALNWKKEARESFDEMAYSGENGGNLPLNGVWLAVPNKHREDISLLSYPRDIGSVSSRWTESQPDDIPVLRKETTTIVEEDEPIQENAKSRYNRWM